MNIVITQVILLSDFHFLYEIYWPSSLLIKSNTSPEQRALKIKIVCIMTIISIFPISNVVIVGSVKDKTIRWKMKKINPANIRTIPVRYSYALVKWLVRINNEVKIRENTKGNNKQMMHAPIKAMFFCPYINRIKPNVVVIRNVRIKNIIEIKRCRKKNSYKFDVNKNSISYQKVRLLL